MRPDILNINRQQAGAELEAPMKRVLSLPRQLIAKLKIYFLALTIKRKFFLILSFLIVLISISSFVILELTIQIYNARLINNSSEVLNLYSSNIENELKKVDNLTLNTLTNSTIQDSLTVINSDAAPPSYERYQMVEGMSNFLLSQAESEAYISSISMIDNNGNVYTAGNSTITFTSSTQMLIEAAAVEQAGKIVWMEPQGSDKDIIAAREIRSVNNLHKLGVIIFRIDPQMLVSSVSSMSPQYNAYLIILSKSDNPIYTDRRIAPDKLDDEKLSKASNGIYTNQGGKFLLNREVSGYTDWSYIYLESYQYVFQNLLIIRMILIACYALVLILMFFVGFKFAKSITQPIMVLSKKMRRIKNVNFDTTDMTTIPDELCDEVGQLNNAFILMLNKINNLIWENYTKQLLMQETQLNALQAQLNPHFLYNTLDSINWLAKANHQEKISVMVKSLGNLMRNSVSNKENVVKLSDELSLLQDYINIQKIRYEERLEFSTEIDEDLMHHLVPKLVLQPIVENSIKYVLEQITGICRIKISSRKQTEYFEIVAQDNGPGIPPDLLEQITAKTYQSKSTGIGLGNIDERFKLLFGDDYGISIPSGSEGMTVILKIPYKPGEANV